VPLCAAGEQVLPRLPTDIASLIRLGMSRSVLSLFVKLAAAALTYAGFIALARTMQPLEYGYFAHGLALATILAVVAGMGQQTAVLKLHAEATADGRTDRAHAVVGHGGSVTLFAALVIAALVVALAFIMFAVPDHGKIAHIAAAGVLVVPMAIAEYQSSALRAQGSIWNALAPRDILWRIGLPLGAICWAVLGYKLDGWEALLMAATLLIAALALQMVVAMRRGLAAWPRLSGVGGYWREQGSMSRWFLYGGIIDVVALNADTVLVGALVSPEQAGVYFNAFRTAGLMTLIGYAVTLALAPLLAQHYHAGDKAKAQLFTSLSALVGFAASVGFFVFFLVFGGAVMSLFGDNFVEAWPILIILAVGLLVEAAMGPSRTVMMMTGQERTYVIAFGVITVVGLALQALILPSAGLIGAALVAMVARIVSQVFIAVWCIQKVGIDPTIFGVFRSVRLLRRSGLATA